MHILIPLKRLDDAKSRLAETMTPAERGELMLSMLTHVAATARAAALGAVSLATSEPEAARLAAELEVGLVTDGGLPWNEGLVHARAQLDPAPDAVLYLAGDLPLLTTGDLHQMAAVPGSVVVARAHDGGTNALLVRPADAMAPAFGVPGSARLHAEAARRLGLRAVTVDLPGLALDVDSPADVRTVTG